MKVDPTLVEFKPSTKYIFESLEFKQELEVDLVLAEFKPSPQLIFWVVGNKIMTRSYLSVTRFQTNTKKLKEFKPINELDSKSYHWVIGFQNNTKKFILH